MNWLCRVFGIGCTPEVPAQSPPQGERAAEAMRHTQIQRSLEEKPLLASCERLASESQKHAEQMQYTNRLTHAGFSGRLAAAEYGIGSENVAFGYATGQDVVEGWMNSAGHRANILGNYTHCGIGVSGDYWCQLFGRKN